MAKTRGGIIKQSGPYASKNKKRKVEEVSKASKKKKNIVEEHESNSDSDTMCRDTQTGDEDEDPLSLPICAEDIPGKSYDLKTWIDEIGSFPAKKIVRARMVVYCDLINLLVQEKNYDDFKGTCCGHLKHISKHFKFNG
ncbi:hypothetical protein H5410_014962 [Solanum commersonii]|uniref:Uncharacterized protein n=1 Tax=Solanum commersonii TaxID=4109 RepID=A0A9J5ZSY2_SOLCO|nr:hypothetical protein H5410_014962 [Solanum commersonii]